MAAAAPVRKILRSGHKNNARLTAGTLTLTPKSPPIASTATGVAEVSSARLLCTGIRRSFLRSDDLLSAVVTVSGYAVTKMNLTGGLVLAESLCGESVV